LLDRDRFRIDTRLKVFTLAGVALKASDAATTAGQVDADGGGCSR
jgi:hypothetical protein